MIKLNPMSFTEKNTLSFEGKKHKNKNNPYYYIKEENIDYLDLSDTDSVKTANTKNSTNSSSELSTSSSKKAKPGFPSPMKRVATKHNIHCAYGGEELSYLRPATAEHVKPRSLGGECRDSNYLPVCELHNSERKTEDLKRLLRNNPEVSENILKTINELKGIEEDTPDGHFSGKDYFDGIIKTISEEISLPEELIKESAEVYAAQHPKTERKTTSSGTKLNLEV